MASSGIKLPLLIIKTTNSQHSVSPQYHHAAHGYTLSTSVSFGEILSLLESPVTYHYSPVVRDTWEPSPEDVERIRFYSTMPYADRGEAIKTWEAGWAAFTKGLSPTHLRRIESRGLDLCVARPPEGSDEWRRIVYGFNKDEYDEMDRLGFLAWDESYRAN